VIIHARPKQNKKRGLRRNSTIFFEFFFDFFFCFFFHFLFPLSLFCVSIVIIAQAFENVNKNGKIFEKTLPFF
jgi:hypothetical protein